MTTITPRAEETYKVKASDHQVYGPVSLATLTEWVKDERVLADTWIHCQSDDSWRKAEAISPLADALGELQRSKLQPEKPVQPSAPIALEELRQFPQFAKLTVQQLEQVRRFGELCVVPAGELVIRQGDPGDALYLVLTGQVRVRLLIGLEDRTLFNISPGQFFGEMALFNNSPRSADVIATVETRLMRVTQQAFLVFIEEIPAIANPLLYHWASMMAERLVAANARFRDETTAEFLWR